MLNDWIKIEQSWANPGTHGENLRLQDFPAFHLVNLAGMVKLNMVHEVLEPWGLSIPEWRLLSTVANNSPISFARISELTGMDKGQVSRTLRTAQGKGYVETEMLPARRRIPEPGLAAVGRVQVRITAAGREMFDKVMPAAQRYQARLIELMSPDERHLFLSLGERLTTLLQGEAQTPATDRQIRLERPARVAAGGSYSQRGQGRV